MKKHRFECGHLGLGKYCHRCDQAAALTASSKKVTDAEKLTKIKKDIERLYAVPKKPGAAMAPSAPVPT